MPAVSYRIYKPVSYTHLYHDSRACGTAAGFVLLFLAAFDNVTSAEDVYKRQEYISSKAIGCKTLFATHYHELISLENELDGVRNYSVKVKRSGCLLYTSMF